MGDRFMKRTRIFIFNLATDLDSDVLAAAHDWVEALAQQYENVEVYSTHVGRVELGSNVKITELGGGNFFRKLLNIMRQIKLLPKLWKFRNSAVVFHHMSSRTLAVLGFPIRLLGIPQAIWYSHSKADLSLKFGRLFSDVIISSTENATPLKGKKVAYLGHGIKISDDKSLEDGHSGHSRAGIVSLGRVSRIKNIEELFFAINDYQLPTQSVTLIGPVSDPTYSLELRKLAAEFNVPLIIEGPKPHSEISKEMKRFKYIFSGTPMSVDKALLEGALAGCFAITSNPEGIRLSGMYEVWKKLGVNHFLPIQEQLSVLEQIGPQLDLELREILIQACRNFNNLDLTALKIKELLNAN